MDICAFIPSPVVFSVICSGRTPSVLDELDKDATILEFLWLSLRQSKGISTEDLQKMGISLDKSVFDRWISKGFLRHEIMSNLLQRKSCYRLEGRGWIFMDDIVTDLANSYSNLE